MLPALIAAFGATPGMLALANLGAQSEASAALTAEQMAQEQLRLSLSTSMEFLMQQLVIGLVPVVQAISPLVQFAVSVMTAGNGLLIKILVAMGVMKTFAVLTSQAQFFARHIAARQLNAARITNHKASQNILAIKTNTVAVRQSAVAGGMMKGIGGGIGKVAGFLGGPWGMLLAAGISFIPGLFGVSKDIKKDQNSSLDELKKQTEILTDSKSDKLLKMINQGITQTNIYSALLSKLSEEQLEAFNAAPALVDLHSPTNQAYDLQ